MGELKATPGPWSVRKHGYLIITDDAKNRWIATIHSVGPENEVREANAHLIAAAPDMYKTLEWLLHIHSIPGIARGEIQKALAKARGAA